MAGFTTNAWLQTYIEKALSLSQEERTPWIESLPSDIAEGLRAWLLEQEAPETGAWLPLLDLASSSGLVKRQVGAYTLISPLGVGGMGAVWLAERTDGRFERKVAIKFILLALSGAEAASRFRQEGMILGRLSHPNIAQLIDAGVTEEGEPYLVLEYVQGAPIDVFFDQAGLNIEQRIRLFLDVLSAVAHAHQNLVVHRDLKPANVLVHDGCEIRLLDFGIAKLLEVNKESDLTQTGIVFTPAYAAPEQLLGQPITTTTDVYSLGVLLFLLLSGQHPYGKEPLSINVVEIRQR
jgi:serine/threonine protein kinase